MAGRIIKLPLALILIVVAGLLLAAAPTGAAPAASSRAAATPSPSPTPNPGSMEPRFFDSTKHYLSGRFRQYWEANGDLYVFGLPLTRVYDEASTDGKVYKTQYFERARFEYHLENPAPFDVELTLMGNESAAGREGEAPFQSAPQRAPAPGDACQFYSEPEDAPKHNVSGPFCAFWQRYGGLQNFGFLLSEEFDEVSPTDGQVYKVQYFERGRWEWHPENGVGSGYEVLLGLLGRERLQRFNVSEAVQAPETTPPVGADIPGGAPVAGNTTITPLKAGHIEYGFNSFLRADFGAADFNNRAVGKVREAGFGWVRLQLVWRDLEPARGQYDWAPLDKRVAAAHGAGLKVLLSVVKSPAWATPGAIAQGRPAGGLPEDPAAFAETMRALAGRYGGEVQAYEIWNEQNLAGEVGGLVEVAPYVATLKAAYTAVKAVDPTVFVPFGGLSPATFSDPRIVIDDVEYLRQFYAVNGGEGRNYFDALAVHAAGTTNPPETRLPENLGPGHCPPQYASLEGTCWNGGMDFYFRRIEDLRAVMEGSGDGVKQVWLTEFGWASCPGGPAAGGYEYCLVNTEQQQADYTVRAFKYARERWPWAGVLILWNLNYAAIPGIPAGDEKAGWSVVRSDWTNRPVYEAVKGMER